VFPTTVYPGRSDYAATGNYFYAESGEQRSHFSNKWEAKQSAQFFRIAETDDSSGIVVNDGKPVSLRSDTSLKTFLGSVPAGKLTIDVTGLTHHVWAPILKSALALGREVEVVYVEPGLYRFSDVPREGDVFDLSDKTLGVRPLPGFVVLSREFEENSIFAALLGFEGARFQYMLAEASPVGDDIFPIVGVPGFRAEYPFYTFEGNIPALTSTGSWKNVLFAAANCPFDCFVVLRKLLEDRPDKFLRIAMIGTKPHSVGAVLFALSQPRRVELVYDFPVRKANRTEGEQRTLVYRVSEFFFSQ
jgi:hypothetical protein